jgi:micrococcal nuclease
VRGTRRIALSALAAVLVLACGGGATPTDRPTSRPPATTFQPGNGDSTPQPTIEPVITIRPRPVGDEPSGETQRVRVVEVYDGDTIVVRIAGEEVEVRYIGIDAPERGTGNIFRRATRANSRLVDGKRVWLEKDVSETDQFDRLLRHVWIKVDGAWKLVSTDLVRRGLAEAVSYPPDTLFDHVFMAAQDAAQDDGIGLWASPSDSDDS